MRIIVLLAAAATCLGACASYENKPTAQETVSMRYDPYNYSMTKLQENATAACRAKGNFTEAERVDNEINSEAVRWAYMNFVCY